MKQEWRGNTRKSDNIIMGDSDSILKPPYPAGKKKLEIVCDAGVRMYRLKRYVFICSLTLLQSSIAKEGDTCVTFMINDEDHTLGNALRYIIMKKYVSPTSILPSRNAP